MKKHPSSPTAQESGCTASDFAATQHPVATRDGLTSFSLTHQRLASRFARRGAEEPGADPQMRFFGPERRAAEAVSVAMPRSYADVTRSARAGQAEQVCVIDLCAISV